MATKDELRAAYGLDRGDISTKNVGRAVVQGISFGFGDEVEAAFRAGLEALASDKEFSQSYTRALESVRGDIDAFRERYPYLAYGAEIAGGLIVPGGATKMAIRGGKTALSAAARGTVTGAATGAVAGFGQGEGGFGNRTVSGAFGAGGGAAVGAAAPAAGKLIQRGAEAFMGPRRAAEQKIAEAVQMDGMTPQQVQSLTNRPLTQGSEARLVDRLGGRQDGRNQVMRDVDAIVGSPTPAANAANRAIVNRRGGQQDRLTGIAKDALGDPEDYVALQTRIAEQRTQLGDLYQPAYDAMPAVNDNRINAFLRSRGGREDMQEALNDLYRYREGGFDPMFDKDGKMLRPPSLEELHHLVQTMEGTAYATTNKTALGGKVNQAGVIRARLRELSRDFDAIQGQYGDASDILRAADAGKTFAMNPTKPPKNAPDPLDAFRAMDAGKQAAFRSGVFGQIIRDIRSQKDGVDVLKKYLGSREARSRFLALVPSDQRSSVLRRLVDEARISVIDYNAGKGSQTAFRQPTQERLGLRGDTSGGMTPDAILMALRGVADVYSEVSGTRTERMLGEMIDMLFTKNPIKQQEAVRGVVRAMQTSEWTRALNNRTVNEVTQRLPGASGGPAAAAVDDYFSGRDMQR